MKEPGDRDKGTGEGSIRVEDEPRTEEGPGVEEEAGADRRISLRGLRSMNVQEMGSN